MRHVLCRRSFRSVSSVVAALVCLSAPLNSGFGFDDAPKEAPRPGVKGGPLNYRWPKGELQAYEIKAITKLGKREQETYGMVELTVSGTRHIGQQPAAVAASPRKTGTGSGFIVGADGWVITSAKTCGWANEIEVRVDRRTYPAKVVELRAQDDLALLKIEADDLTPLPVIDPSKVAEGDEVRAIGFPAGSGAGDKPKVVRAGIEKVLKPASQSRLQLDTSIPASHWGSPLFNETGAVIGVGAFDEASSSATESHICTSSQRVLDLLGSHKIKPVESPAKPLSGAALLEAIQPSLALITARSVATAPQEAVLTTLQFTTLAFAPSGENIVPPTHWGLMHANVDTHGRVNDYYGGEQLAFGLGPISRLLFLPLPDDDRTEWVHNESFPLARLPLPPVFAQKNEQTARQFIRTGQRYPRSNNDRKSEAEATNDATESFRYRVRSDKGDLLTINVDGQLEAAEKGTFPSVKVTTSGQYDFSRKLGLIEFADLTHDFRQTADGTTTQASVHIVIKREKPQALLDRKKREADALATSSQQFRKQQAAQVGAVPKAAEAAKPTKTVQEIVKELSGYQAGTANYFQVRDALAQLQLHSVDLQQKDKVELELLTLLGSKHGTSNEQLIMQCLTTWGSKKSIPKLREKLKAQSPFVAKDAFMALAAVGGVDVLEDLLAAIHSSRIALQTTDVSQALRPIGKPAEKAIIKRLETPSDEPFAWHRSHMLISVLGDIGEEDSAVALQKIVSSENRSLSFHAAEPLKKVRIRVEAKADAKANPGAPQLSIAAREVDELLRAVKAAQGNAIYEPLQNLARGPVVEEMRDKVQDDLLAFVKRKQETSTRYAFTALQHWISPRMVEPLVELLKSPDYHSKTLAIDTLALIGDKSHSDLFCDLLTDDALRSNARAALQKVELSPTSQKTLIGLLKSEKSDVQLVALELLGWHGVNQALPEVDRLARLDGQVRIVNIHAVRAASQIQRQASTPKK